MSASTTGLLGGRCIASDPLGNRCHKDAMHTDGADTGARRHDASRGDLQRLWA